MLALLMCLVVCSIPQVKTLVKKVPAHLGTSLHSMTQTTPMRDRSAEPATMNRHLFFTCVYKSRHVVLNLTRSYSEHGLR